VLFVLVGEGKEEGASLWKWKQRFCFRSKEVQEKRYGRSQ